MTTYLIFGKQYNREDYQKVLMKNVKDRSLLELYDLFEKVIDNAHTSKESVVLYFLLNDDKKVDLLWTCSHYEGTNISSITGMAHFLTILKYYMGDESEICLDLIDGFYEKLIITIYNVPFKFPNDVSEIKNSRMDYEGEEDKWN